MELSKQMWQEIFRVILRWDSLNYKLTDIGY